MKQTNSFAKIIASTALTVLSLQAFAGPGTLITSPLFINATVASNIMFVVDNSRSMKHVAEEDFSATPDPDKYDKTKTYIDNCTSPVSNASTISYFIFIDGADPKVRTSINSGTKQTVSYDTNNDTTGSICFNPIINYKAGIHATAGSEPTYNFTALYTGNYLNWYFTKNNTNNTGGSVGNVTWTTTAVTGRIKPGTQTRKTIAKDSLTSLITALELSDVDIRLGLASFEIYDNSAGRTVPGAYIFDEIKYLDDGQRDSIIANLANLGTGNGTPLAHTLHQIGRYYMGEGNGTSNGGNLGLNAGVDDTNGYYSGDLTLHPSTTATTKDATTEVFTNKPRNTSATRESPIQYWCQNNFAVVMTDGLPTNDRHNPNMPSDLRDYDGDCASATPACINSAPPGTRSGTHYDMKATGQGYIYELEVYSSSDYFDDVAKAMNEIDLRPDINKYDGSDVVNKVTTYTIAFADQDALNNQLLQDAGTHGGGGGVISASDGQDLITKFTEVTNTILSTTSSAAAVTFNTSTLGSDAAVYQALFSTARWSGDINSYPVDPTYGTIDFNCDPDLPIPDSLNCWTASSQLDALVLDTDLADPLVYLNSRQIITFEPATRSGIAFLKPPSYPSRSPGEITTEMVKDICAGPDAPAIYPVGHAKEGLCKWDTTIERDASRVYIEQMVNYIRGDDSRESTTTAPTFRTRQTALGDIINAAPIFVGSPNLPWPSFNEATNKFGEGASSIPPGTGKRYLDFKAAQAYRTKVLYASSNDGMLHAFNTVGTSTTLRERGGDELFAYIPSFVFSDQAAEGLHHLAEPTYTHKYYLDLSPTFTDIYMVGKDASNAPTYKTASPEWRTVLIGGSRGGAKKGIFALDITDPTTITEANAANTVLWEFTDAHDADLGFTYSKPTIALTNAVDGSGNNRWAAIFGNGYQSDGLAVSNGSSCHAILFVVFLDGGLDGNWTLGTNPDTADYMKIDTKVGSNLTAGACNGLSTPALIDTNGDQILDRVYAGDVQGNMWAFDLTCGGNCAFDVAYGNSTTPKPLFTAKDPLDVIQPIMSKPTIARNTAVGTSTTTDPNVLVLFGTGQYHNAIDNAGTAKINTFYGIWDSGTAELTDNRANDSSNGSNLVGQTLSTQSVDTRLIRNITSNTIDWSSKYGWYIDLAPENSGLSEAEERVVVSPALRSTVLFFNTLIPNSQKCGFGGSGWLMSIDYLTGGAPDSTVFDANRDNVVDASDDIGGSVAVGEQFDGIPADSSFLGDNQYTQSSDQNIVRRKISTPAGLREGRLSWRELFSN